MINIEKDVPMPPKLGRPATTVYPYKEMEVGDSFRVDGPEKVSKIRTMASTTWGPRTGFKFSVRVEPGGCRIWRVS